MNSINRKLLIAGIILISILFLVLFLIRYNYLNTKYPEVIIDSSSMNEPVNYFDFSLCAEKYAIINQNEIKEKNIISEQLPSGFETKMVLVTLNIKNTSTQEKTIELYPFVLESNGWRSAFDFEAFNKLNSENVSTSLRLKPGKSQTVILPFTMYNSQFKKDYWAKLQNKEFDLIFSLYPIKKYIKLYNG